MKLVSQLNITGFRSTYFWMLPLESVSVSFKRKNQLSHLTNISKATTQLRCSLYSLRKHVSFCWCIVSQCTTSPTGSEEKKKKYDLENAMQFFPTLIRTMIASSTENLPTPHSTIEPSIDDTEGFESQVENSTQL